MSFTEVAELPYDEFTVLHCSLSGDRLAQRDYHMDERDRLEEEARERERK